MNTAEFWLHVACNDRNGMMDPPPEVDTLNVYVGGELALEANAGYPLMFRHVEGQECRERGFAAGIKFYGVGAFAVSRIAHYVGNIHWNAYRMDPADLCRLMTSLRDLYGWEAESGWTPVFEAMHTKKAPITPAVFALSMSEART